jgi:hypothetical protein
MSLCLLLLGAAVASWGCVESGERWRDPEASLQPYEVRRFALLTVASSPSVSGEQLEATGQFVEYSGPSESWALQALDLWVPPDPASAELDGCRVDVEPFGDPEAPDGVDAAIRLLDAGRISLRRHGGTATLERYSLPGLQTYLSGVFYEITGVAAPEPRVVQLANSGAPEVEPFAVTAELPATIRMSAVDGLPRGSFDAVALSSSRDLLIEWSRTASDAPGVVYFDLYDDARSATALLSCVARDDGLFRVPADALRRITERYPDAALRLVARRAAVVHVPLAGFEWAQAVVQASDVVFLVAR